MKKCFILLLLYGVISCGFSKFETAIDGQSPGETNITVDQTRLIFSEAKDFPNGTQFSIALIEKDSVKFYGIKRTNDTIYTYENQDKVFEIGSITKVFTATLLAGLVLDDKLNLKDRFANYLEFPVKGDPPVTFLHLANHTSGLPRLPSNLNLKSVDPKNPYKEYDENAMIHYLRNDFVLEQPPGDRFVYSNLGAGILGFVLSRIEGEDYETLLQSRIFSKYRMLSSTTRIKNIQDRLVKGIDVNGNETSNWDLNIMVGAGGVLSSASDLSKFALAQLDENEERFRLTQQTTFKIRAKRHIGLGWFIREDIHEKIIEHDGGTGGYLSTIQLDIKNRKGVIILSNVSAFNKSVRNIHNLGTRLMLTLSDN